MLSWRGATMAEGWAKIEIEFQPEKYDPNEVLTFLYDHFKTKEGVPTAVVRLIAVAPQPQLDDLARLADQVWAMWRNPPGAVGTPSGAVIQAIKDLRGQAKIGLKEAKDAIDAARARNP